MTVPVEIKDDQDKILQTHIQLSSFQFQLVGFFSFSWLVFCYQFVDVAGEFGSRLEVAGSSNGHPWCFKVLNSQCRYF